MQAWWGCRRKPVKRASSLRFGSLGWRGAWNGKVGGEVKKGGPERQRGSPEFREEPYKCSVTIHLASVHGRGEDGSSRLVLSISIVRGRAVPAPAVYPWTTFRAWQPRTLCVAPRFYARYSPHEPPGTPDTWDTAMIQDFLILKP